MEPVPVMQDSYTGAVDQSKSFIVKVYMWMSLGLFLTAGISIAPYLILGPNTYESLIYQYIYVIYGLMVVEFLIVLGLSFLLNKIPAVLGFLLFLAYSALNGITLSPIFLIYTGGSIFSTFLVCGMMFAGTSVLGFITKMDLSRFGGFLTMALIGLVVAMVVNMFLNSNMMTWIISLVGVVIFVGLTAYDTQKIKNMAGSMEAGTEESKKASVMGALMLYLDFINMFLFLLRLLGKRN
jgi:uncharacterized protein